ncbi:MAG: polyprenyl synthetase family protein [Planctomycetota bacterium]
MSQIISGSTSMDAEAPTGTNALNGLHAVYAPIMSELRKVETILQSELNNDTPLVDELLNHSRLLGGKRIRPVFLLLSAACTGGISERHLKMSAALEMIHTATLIHDDLLDNAHTRRHRPTANATWGAKQTVLLGDYLFTHSFYLASLAGSAEALKMLAQASNLVCEGEMRQNAYQGNFELDEPTYIKLIADKTAELCGVGCRLGAFLNDASDEEIRQHYTYGRNLGISFQIIDDVLDIVGSPDNVGKTLGTDLINQKPTLPVIHAIATRTGQAKTELKEFLQLPVKDVKAANSRLIHYLNETDSIEYARGQARAHAESAIQFAESLHQSEYSQALVFLANFVLSRTH